MPVAKKLHDSCHWLPGNLAVYLRQEEVQLMKLVPGVTQAAPPRGQHLTANCIQAVKTIKKLVTLLFWMLYSALEQTTNSVVCLVICTTPIQILFMHFLRVSVSQFNVLYTFCCSFSQVAFVPTQNCIKRSCTINIEIT